MAHLCIYEKCVTLFIMLGRAWPAADIEIIGMIYDRKNVEISQEDEKKGLVQVRIWVEEQDEEFIKYIAKFCREVREKKQKKRYGRRASQQQIDFAKALAKSKNVSEPDHLYDYHISLAGWTWSYRGKQNELVTINPPPKDQ